MADLEKRVAAIEARNKRVEADKSWETSLVRRVLILALTYLVMVVFMLFADIDKPFISAIIPALGFALSTLTVSYVKEWWVKHRG